MKWFLEEKYSQTEHTIEYGDYALFMGSCFSQNIVEKGKNKGFKFESTQHGTIFHPIPIARIIEEAIEETNTVRIVENNDNRYYSFDASSKFFGLDVKEFEASYLDLQIGLKNRLKEAKYLFITFGTAKSYSQEDGVVVANCHKLPSNQFKVEISDLDVLVATYSALIEKLNVFNPKLNIVFTVSPVRHAKDGLIANNRSKARLLMLCEELEKMDKVSYFPAYELIVDQLRDYRFYNSDLIHPNSEAVNFVWKTFEEVYFSDETKRLIAQVDKFKAYFNHIPIHRENDRELGIRKIKEQELKEFQSKNPKIVL